MNHKRARTVLSGFVVATTLSAMAPCFGAELPESAKAQIRALEMRVAALEEMKEVGTIAATSAATPRRKLTEAARSSAAGVERYLQYPGQ